MNRNILLNSARPIYAPYVYSAPIQYTLAVNCSQVGWSLNNYHEYLEICYHIGGHKMMYIEDRSYEMQPGDVLVINPYDAHRCHNVEKGVGYFSFYFSEEFCRINGIDPISVRIQEYIQSRDVGALFKKAMITARSGVPFREAAMHCAALELLVKLCQEYSEPVSANQVIRERSHQFIAKTSAYIRDHVATRISVKEIAQQFGLSEYHFMREFKRLSGITLSNFINLTRCAVAKELLRRGDVPIKKVAESCGFESASYFAKIFLQHTGQLPSEYVEALRGPI